MKNYENIALEYAEKRGITEYEVKNNLMIFTDTWFQDGKFLKYERTIDLDTMTEKCRLLL